MPRYLTPSALVAVRYLTAERLRSQRPRRAARVRGYVSDPVGDLAPLAAAVRQLLQVRGAA